jgi:regulator of sirC expression with transglutaminase-like and TPR domain
VVLGENNVSGIHSRFIQLGLPLLLASLISVASADDKNIDAQVRQWIIDLGDKKFVIRQAAYEQLTELGKPAFPQLKRIARSGTPEQRYRAREIIRLVEWRTLYKGFLALSKQPDDEMDLDEAMWLISLIVDSRVEREPLGRQLDDMAKRVRARLGKKVDPAKVEPRVVVDVLIAVLKDEYKLAGAFVNYNHPDNSSLDRVLSSKKGLPILLSHIAVSIADRLEIPVVGIPTAGRYMIKYDGSRAPEGSPDDDIIIDPFGNWQILTHDGVRELIPGFDPETDLVPSSRRATIVRMLRNLASDFSDVQQPEKAALTEKCLQLF